MTTYLEFVGVGLGLLQLFLELLDQGSSLGLRVLGSAIVDRR